eukprot:900846-Pleurochrysis_carterae.AAC.1
MSSTAGVVREAGEAPGSGAGVPLPFHMAGEETGLLLLPCAAFPGVEGRRLAESGLSTLFDELRRPSLFSISSVSRTGLRPPWACERLPCLEGGGASSMDALSWLGVG